MKRFVLIIASLIFSFNTYAQEEDNSHKKRTQSAINVRAYGGFSYTSINYESIFHLNERNFISGEIGFGYGEGAPYIMWAAETPSRHFLTIPHHITGNYGKGRHYFEYGLSGTVLYVLNQNGYESEFHSYVLAPKIGYRFLALKSKKMYFKINASFPIHDFEEGTSFYVPVGLSIGYIF